MRRGHSEKNEAKWEHPVRPNSTTTTTAMTAMTIQSHSIPILFLLEINVILNVFGDFAFALHGDRLGKISVRGRIGQVQDRRGVIGEDEGKDRILHQVVGRPSGHLIELHQIFKVGDLSLDPKGLQLDDVGGLDAPQSLAAVGKLHAPKGLDQRISIFRRLQRQQQSTTIGQKHFDRPVFQ